MNTLLLAIAIAAAVLVSLGAFVLLWLRATLLSGVVVVQEEQVDPALKKQIDRLQLEYEVAEDLGYSGQELLGIESQLNAARLAAAADVYPDATLPVIVPESVELVPEAAPVHPCLPLPALTWGMLPGLPSPLPAAAFVAPVSAKSDRPA